MGTLFGSFFTLAVYRIPLNKDISHERSFCPNCNHKLGFWDLIPVLSYIFARGKCRYCGQKIRIRYLILEVLSGLVFLIGYLALNMQFPFVEIDKLMFFAAFVFMYVTVAIISGIDKEYRKIEMKVLLFGLIMQSVYILYLYVINKVSMYRYSIYLFVMLFLWFINKLIIKKTGESKYIVQILMFVAYIAFCIGGELLLFVTLLATILVIMYNVYARIKQSFNDEANILKDNELPQTRIGFFLGISTVLVVLIETFITYM